VKITDNGTGLSTLYTGLGVKLALTVTVPPAAGLTGPSTPTGTVFNGSSDRPFSKYYERYYTGETSRNGDRTHWWNRISWWRR